MTPLHIIDLGLTPTGKEDEYNPRKEYKLTKTGAYNLAHFLGLDAQSILANKMVQLTPATVEDFLIFHAFNQKRKFVIIVQKKDGDEVTREHYVTDDKEEAIFSKNAGNYVIPNIAVLLTHSIH